MEGEDVSKLRLQGDVMGRIIGKKGATIKEIREKSGATVEVDEVVTESGAKSCEVTIRGGAEERERAAELVNDATR